jgi:hypothetical protein
MQLPVLTMVTGYPRWLSAVLMPTRDVPDLFFWLVAADQCARCGATAAPAEDSASGLWIASAILCRASEGHHRAGDGHELRQRVRRALGFAPIERSPRIVR